MNPNDQTSLKKLYQQRKNDITAPASLTQSLLKAKPKKSKFAQWSVALPTLAASLLVVVIIWPNTSTTLNTALYSESADRMLLNQNFSDSNLVDEQTEMEATEINQRQMSDSVVGMMTESAIEVSPQATSQAMAKPAPKITQSKQAPAVASAPAPLEKDSADVPMSTVMTTAETTGIKPSAAKRESTVLMADSQTLLSDKTQIVKVVNGKKGEFKNCAQETILLDAEVEFESSTWLTASTTNDGNWQFSVLDGDPCQ